MREGVKPRSSVAASMGEAAKHPCLLVLWRRLVYGESCKTLFVLMRSRRRVYGGNCITLVSVSPLASPCLWGKLQNIVRFDVLTSPCLWGKLHNLNLCFSAGVAVSMGEAAKHRSSVAVSMGEAAKLASLLVLWRRRVYGGSCITLVSVSPLASPSL